MPVLLLLSLFLGVGSFLIALYLNVMTYLISGYLDTELFATLTLPLISLNITFWSYRFDKRLREEMAGLKGTFYA